MKTTRIIQAFVAALTAAAALTFPARPAQAADEAGILDPEAWPRVYEAGKNEIADVQ